MEYITMDLVQSRITDLRGEAERDRLVHLARPNHRADRAQRAHRSGPGLIRRALALR